MERLHCVYSEVGKVSTRDMRGQMQFTEYCSSCEMIKSLPANSSVADPLEEEEGSGNSRTANL